MAAAAVYKAWLTSPTEKRLAVESDWKPPDVIARVDELFPDAHGHEMLHVSGRSYADVLIFQLPDKPGYFFRVVVEVAFGTIDYDEVGVYRSRPRVSWGLIQSTLTGKWKEVDISKLRDDVPPIAKHEEESAQGSVCIIL
jgi:hypothetical protein